MKTLTGENKKVFKKALKLSRGLYKHNFDDLFQGKNRIHIPVNYTDYEGSSSYKIVNNYLKDNGYIIVDYIGGYAVKEDDSNQKNKFKIGKLLKSNNYVLNNFRDCPHRQKLKLVISRHPYDIACASYNQEWESCLHFNGGINHHCLKASMYSNMLLIAYLVTASTNTVMGRMFVIPYWEKDQCEVWLHTADIGYGIFPQKHRDFLRDWLNKEYNYKHIYPKLDDSIFSWNFSFPEDVVYDNGDDKKIRIYNIKYMNNKYKIRKLINENKIINRISLMYRKNGSQGLTKNWNIGVIKKEVNAWVDYHQSYERDDINFKKMVWFKKWLHSEPIDESDANKYLNFLKYHKLKISHNDILQDYVITRGLHEMEKYLKLLHKPIKWDEGKEQINTFATKGHFKINGVIHKRLLKMFV